MNVQCHNCHGLISTQYNTVHTYVIDLATMKWKNLKLSYATQYATATTDGKFSKQFL